MPGAPMLQPSRTARSRQEFQYRLTARLSSFHRSSCVILVNVRRAFTNLPISDSSLRPMSLPISRLVPSRSTLHPTL